MSYDFDISQAPCDHLQSTERYIVDPLDFRTLRLAANTSIYMRAPINSTGNVLLYIGGQLVSRSDPNYGYTVVLDTSRVQESEETFYKIVFNKQVRILIPLIEVTYFTVQTYCIKCNGIGQLNDLKKANNGSLLHVFQTNKMVQKSLKYILTSFCPFYPQYTCPIKGYVGKKYGVQITDADIASAVMSALQKMKQVQNAQRTIQVLDPFETLKDISNVISTQEPTDPTRVNVALRVSSYGTSTTQALGFTLTTTKSAQQYSPGGSV